MLLMLRFYFCHNYQKISNFSKFLIKPPYLSNHTQKLLVQIQNQINHPKPVMSYNVPQIQKLCGKHKHQRHSNFIQYQNYILIFQFLKQTVRINLLLKTIELLSTVDQIIGTNIQISCKNFGNKYMVENPLPTAIRVPHTNKCFRCQIRIIYIYFFKQITQNQQKNLHIYLSLSNGVVLRDINMQWLSSLLFILKRHKIQCKLHKFWNLHNFSMSQAAAYNLILIL
eukprot:TRINITY_DN1083_c0_g1_i4.p1 TRINITY_DN1083_c0_g1~~TRINITY_DN1083_c0_g1_i4.p1  ORF type:complete len:226 (-),score=-25.87 TRINITY_DN1083_c0_g1_i4:535-1212(-)